MIFTVDCQSDYTQSVFLVEFGHPWNYIIYENKEKNVR